MPTNTTTRRVIKSIGNEFEEHRGVRYQNASVLDFDGQEYVLSHKAILTVVVLSSCNAACTFCSNEITFTPFGKPLTWSDGLARVRDFALLGGIRKVAYSGGEPTLNPQALIELVTQMSKGFTRSRLHTNSYGLFHTVEHAGTERMLLDALIDEGLTGVSISIAHHEPEPNARIMRFPPSWPGPSEDDLRRIAERGDSTFSPRLSCVMTDEGVADVADMFDYIRWGRSLGFRRFIFRSCSAIPDGFKKDTDFTTFNDGNLRSVDELAAELESVPGLELTYRQRKSDSKVDVYRWGDVTFDVDESSEESDPDPKIRRLNLMPDGICYTSWIDETSNLFPDDAARREESMRRQGPVRVAIGSRTGGTR